MIPFFANAREWELLRERLLPEIEAVLASGRVLQGPAVAAFERDLAAWTGRRHAVAVGSGTDALAFALHASGIGPGDQVLVPAFTFIATASAVLRVGARPVFGDVDEDGLLDLTVAPPADAVIAVGLYGRVVDAGALGIPVIEDCAQSLSAPRAGSIGVASCCSFDPTKTLSAPGSGGALLTDDDTLAERVRELRWHGRDAAGAYSTLGYNSQLPSASAAVLGVKLEKQDAWRARRAAIAARWADAAGDIAPTVVDDHAWSKFVLRAPGQRDALRARLESAGIPTLIHYATPLHRQPVFATSGPGACPVADRLAGQVLSLPLHAMLTDAEVEHIGATLRNA